MLIAVAVVVPHESEQVTFRLADLYLGGYLAVVDTSVRLFAISEGRLQCSDDVGLGRLFFLNVGLVGIRLARDDGAVVVFCVGDVPNYWP